MPKYKPEQVFTPSCPAVNGLAYAPREQLEHAFRGAMDEPGTQLLVFGDSTVGKTSFVLTEMQAARRSYVRIQCSQGMTWRRIGIELLRLLDEGIVAREQRTRQQAADLGMKTYFASATFSDTAGVLVEELKSGEMGSVQHVTDVLSKRQLTVVIDDFEKVTSAEAEAAIANVAKGLSDLSSSGSLGRLIIVGISDNAHELIDADKSISSRLLPLHVTRMTDAQIEMILSEGFNRLGIGWQSELDKLARTSELATIAPVLGGFPKYAHALGLEMARSVRRRRRSDLDPIAYQQGITGFAARYCRQTRAAFDRATVVRGRKNVEYDVLIKAMASVGLRQGFSVEDACQEIPEYLRKEVSSLKPQTPAPDRIKALLTRLSRPARGSIFKRSKQTGKYHFADPLFPVFIKLSFAWDGRV